MTNRSFVRTLLIVLLFSANLVFSAEVTWTGTTSSDWMTGANWSNSTGPVQSDAAIINSGTPEFSSGTTPSYNAIRQNGGTVTFSGGTFNCANNSSWESWVNGSLLHTGTEATINFLEIGRSTGATGHYALSGGILKVSRANSGVSLFLGGNKSSGAAGTGTLEISGGTFTTRSGVRLGHSSSAGIGHFKVLGSQIGEVGIANANTDSDGTWEQNSGSTLTVGIDFGGLTPIVIHDSTSNTSGTSATFENGSLLSVEYLYGYDGGGTWTLMEVENGDIINNGLAFAPGVDTGVWSFNIDNSGANGLLTVTSTSTNVIKDAYWDGSEDTLWENPLNWTNNFGAFDECYVHIAEGTIDYTTASEAGINLRGFRMLDGTLNILSGELRATQLASAYSQMDGAVHQSGGLFDVNALELGREVGSTATYQLIDGELKIGRAKNGYSLYLGGNSSSTNSGSGTLTISGGKFTTRTSVKLGDASDTGTGKFVVLGSAATEIGIASANIDYDGTWEQYSGSTLQVGIDTGGVTPIFLKDGSASSGTSATFASGSLLDVDYYNISSGGGTWTVMEVENGSIIDNGLAFAPGVDTNIWSFSVDNSGTNGRLLVTAVGNPLGHALTIGNVLQQKMRYGMDYERLWYWTGGLNGSERDQIARWTTVDADVDFVRVAVNSEYELTEGSYNLSAYTDKIIPVMQEMQQANPNIKFFASPRPLNEAVSGATWQPYPLWVTGAPSYTSSSFDFSWQKCSEYLVRYLLLMKSYGFKISFLDVTNEWQSNVGGGRLTQDDMDSIENYLRVTYMNAPWPHPALDPSLVLVPDDIPEIVAPSSWNYSQGTQWINNLDSGDKEAISIAASHNTDRTGDAQTFATAVRNQLGTDTEIWNTELHGWKSTSNENETTSFYYYIEAIRAGFGGINGWLAIGTTGQGHSYILNPSGTPTRNVKYHIYQKLSSTSNYGHALNIVQEPSALTIPLGSNDDDIPRNVAAFIKGNLMTVWVINESANTVPLVVTPAGRTIAESSVRRTRWTDPSDVEGFETYEPVNSNTSFSSSIPAESVCCFEIVLDTEDFSNDLIQAENYSHQWGTGTEDHGSYVNLSNVSDDDFTRYGGVALTGNSVMSFHVARPNGRPDGIIEIREGNAEGPLLGQVAVPVTGNWQSYQTVTTTLNVDAGIYNLYLKFAEDTTTTGNALFNVDWFTVNDPPPAPAALTATAAGSTQINLAWNAVSGATDYIVKRSTSSGGPFTTIASSVVATTYSDTAVTPGTTYYYVVTAQYGSTESGPSNEANATPPLPAAPTGLTAVAFNASQIDLSWTAAAGATGYNVKRSTTDGSGHVTVGSPATASFSDSSGLTAGTRYYYVVTALYGVTESSQSTQTSAVPSNPIDEDKRVIGSVGVISNGGGGEDFKISIPDSELGYNYQVQASDDLTPGSFANVSSVMAGNGGLVDFEIPIDPMKPRRFYRISYWRQ